MTSAETPTASSAEAPPAAQDSTTARRVPRWRRILVGVLVVLGCVLAPLSILGVWVHSTLLDTDQWVATVDPLIDSPAVQSAVATRVSNAVVDETDLEEEITDLLPDRAKALAGVITTGAQQAAEQATLKIVESDQFERLWETINRNAHARVVAVLQGEGTETVSTENGQVVLHLGPVVATVKDELKDRGISLFDNVNTPRARRDIVIFSSDDLTQAQGLVDLLDKIAVVLPILTFVVFAAAIALSGNRRRTVLRAALGVALAMGILLTAFNIGRTFYLDALPSTVNRDAAEVVYDQILSFLRTSVRTSFWIAIVVAFGAWLAGAGHVAVRVRETVRRGVERGADAGNVDEVLPAPVAVFVGHYRNALRVLVVGLGFVVLMAIDHPHPVSVLVTAVLVVIGLIVIEILGRAAPGSGTSAPDTTVGAGT